MTVNELNEITKALISKGHGELDVCIEDQARDMVTSFEVRLNTGTYYKWTEGGYEGKSKMFVDLTLNTENL